MLKNVAIPLMLAATEAEAALSKGDLAEAMRADKDKDYAGLQAGEAACTPEVGVTKIGEAEFAIGALAQTTSDKQAALDAANQAVVDLTADTGAWGLANIARKAAVEAAVASEAASNIAGLIDAADTAAGAERAAAQAYLDADKAYQAGVRRLNAATSADGAASTEAARLLGLKTASAQAVTDAKDQHAKELLWREWLYCELGGVPATDPNNAETNWWKMIASDSTISGAGAAPTFCTVPNVLAADGTTVERPAVKYYGSTSDLAAEDEEAGPPIVWRRWSATLIHTTATTAENSTSSYQGQDRNQAGKVAWHAGDKRAKDWVNMQRIKELALYTEVQVSRGSAASVANSQATDSGADVTATATATETAMGLTGGAAGAAKALAAAATTRDANDADSPGSGFRIASSRAQDSSPNAWRTAWTLDAGALDTWTAVTRIAESKTHIWWAVARLHSAAVQTWHTYYETGSNSDEVTVGSMTMTEVQTATPAAGKCNTGAGTWTSNTASNAATSAATCQAACESTTVAALIVNPDTTAGSAGALTTANNGGATMANFANGAQTANWCAAFSFDNAEGTAANKCKLMLSVTTGLASADSDEASSKCGKYVSTELGQLVTNQDSVQSTWAAVTAQMHADIVTQMDAQAALEKAWLEAWYLQQYWTALNTALNTATGGSLAETYAGYVSTLSGVGTSDQTTQAGAQAFANNADTALQTAQSDLATLQATTAAAEATVTELGKRILRAGVELAELDALANAGATGTLDAAAALRAADSDAYAADGTSAGVPKGTRQLAADELAAATTPVAARSGDGSTADGGALTEARITKQGEWDTAKSDLSDAQGALTAALDGVDLAALRQTVEDDTAAWSTQNDALDGLAQASIDAAEELKNAMAAQAEATMNCQVAAYDLYREELNTQMVNRLADLKTIKELLETQSVKPNPGTAGARCEKALSNGTWRPARGEQACDEGLCCGAARVWMGSGSTADAAWRTIETCQLETATSYAYQPARAPMATAMPGKITVDFACIEGAHKLAAAASAVAAAVYMLA